MENSLYSKIITCLKGLIIFVFIYLLCGLNSFSLQRVLAEEGTHKTFTRNSITYTYWSNDSSLTDLTISDSLSISYTNSAYNKGYFKCIDSDSNFLFFSNTSFFTLPSSSCSIIYYPSNSVLVLSSISSSTSTNFSSAFNSFYMGSFSNSYFGSSFYPWTLTVSGFSSDFYIPNSTVYNIFSVGGYVLKYDSSLKIFYVNNNTSNYISLDIADLDSFSYYFDLNYLTVSIGTSTITLSASISRAASVIFYGSSVNCLTFDSLSFSTPSASALYKWYYASSSSSSSPSFYLYSADSASSLVSSNFAFTSSSYAPYPQSINYLHPNYGSDLIADWTKYSSRFTASNRQYMSLVANRYDPSSGVLSTYWAQMTTSTKILGDAFDFDWSEIEDNILKVSINCYSSRTLLYTSEDNFSVPTTPNFGIDTGGQYINFNVIQYLSESGDDAYYFISNIQHDLETDYYWKFFILSFDPSNENGETFLNNPHSPYLNTFSDINGWYYIASSMRLVYPNNEIPVLGDPDKTVSCDELGNCVESEIGEFDDTLPDDYFNTSIDDNAFLSSLVNLGEASELLKSYFTGETGDIQTVIDGFNENIIAFDNYSVSLSDSEFLSSVDFMTTQLEYIYNNSSFKIPIDIACITSLIMGVIF